jgi:tetratricopeptide (TPR) repeat protein
VRERLPAIALALFGLGLTLAAYWPALDAGFVLDDQPNIVDGYALHWTEISVASLRETLSDATLVARPVANLSLALNHRFGGLEPRGYHAVNLILHLAVGGALVALARRLVLENSAAEPRERAAATLAALAAATLFCVHPLNIQAVTYVVQRMTSLATLFSLLSLGCWLAARRRGGAARAAWGALCGLCFALACGSKEIAYMLPVVIVAWELCFRRDSWPRPGPRLWAGLALALLAAAAVAWLYDIPGRFHWLEPFEERDFNGYQRILTQSRVMFFYLSLLVWPAASRLNLEHEFALSTGLLSPWTTAAAVLAWLAIGAACLRLAAKRPRVGFPLVAALLFSLIESGPISLELVFEHRVYLPLTMLAVLLTVGLFAAPARWRVPACLGIALLALPLAWQTNLRNQLWADTEAFYRDTAARSPSKFRPHYALGTMLGRQGNAEAVEFMRRALAIKPDDAMAHTNLGNILLQMGRREEALGHYRAALRSDPQNMHAHLNLAQLIERQQPERAADHYRRFLALAPRQKADEIRLAEERLRVLASRRPGRRGSRDR